MFNRIAIWLAGVATVAAGIGSQACYFTFLFDEPKAPKSLIK